jgi:hypothetical protein
VLRVGEGDCRSASQSVGPCFHRHIAAPAEAARRGRDEGVVYVPVGGYRFVGELLALRSSRVGEREFERERPPVDGPATSVDVRARRRVPKKDVRVDGPAVELDEEFARWRVGDLVGDSGGVDQMGPAPRRDSDSVRRDGRVGAVVKRSLLWVGRVLVLRVRDWERR